MQDPTFMYGVEAKPEEVITVLLIGFDGRRRVLTGTHDTCWNEFLHGDWEYWCRQPLGTLDHEACCNQSIETLVTRKDN